MGGGVRETGEIRSFRALKAMVRRMDFILM